MFDNICVDKTYLIIYAIFISKNERYLCKVKKKSTDIIFNFPWFR